MPTHHLNMGKLDKENTQIFDLWLSNITEPNISR